MVGKWLVNGWHWANGKWLGNGKWLVFCRWFYRRVKMQTAFYPSQRVLNGSNLRPPQYCVSNGLNFLSLFLNIYFKKKEPVRPLFKYIFFFKNRMSTTTPYLRPTINPFQPTKGGLHFYPLIKPSIKPLRAPRITRLQNPKEPPTWQ